MDIHNICTDLSKIKRRTMSGILIVVANLSTGFSSQTQAQELLYSIVQTSPSARLQQTQSSPAAEVRFGSTDSKQLRLGEKIQVALPDGSISLGTVSVEHNDSPLNPSTMTESSSTKVISIGDGKSLDIHVDDGSIIGLTLSDHKSQNFYRAVIDNNGSGILAQEDNAEYVCAYFPRHTDDDQLTAEINPAHVPSLATVQNLQSKPGASKVLFIDNWGGTLTDSAWNTNTPIQYDRYSLDSDPAFSETERYHMYQAWAETAEDYAPFNVNVTTNSAIFSAAANEKKTRIIATTETTRETYGLCNNCGGVAFVGVFGRTDDRYQTGWSFNSSLTSMGMTHSHEAGHQMGLAHDGTRSLSYYSGHGDWGPIMGAPFGKRYVQWSKGEYPGANEFQDDFSIIDNKLGTLGDDVGGSVTRAEALGNSTDVVRKINPLGATGSPDNDYFKFSVGANGAAVNLNIAPLPGLDTIQSPNGEDRSSNLAIEARLWRAGSITDIAAISPGDTKPLRPNTNKLIYAGTLLAGDYNIRVNNQSPDTNWSTGFGEWGHGGSYRIKLEVVPIQLCKGKTVTVDISAGDLPTSGGDVILGTSGDDTINAGGGADTICGLGGNDTIDGGTGSDWIDGGDGDDTISGGAGSDKIFGGRGADLINGGSGNDKLYGQSSADTIYGDAGADKIYGGQNNDRLFGGDGSDRIWGESGNDLILGGAGDDSWLDGGEHNDRVSGQQGNDIVRGGSGNDKIFGGPGNDDIRAQAGNDLITDGGQGTDQCQVAPGIDAAAVNCE